ncbi:hypothetical protein Hanom_Chr16g01440051 [Helianthus anomalus]
MGMVRIQHFEFICRSQGEEPTVDKFRAFYQLQSNIGFFSFSLHVAKKILINPLKSYHDWKMKFFFIRTEVKISRGAMWYEKRMALPNQAFGEQVLVATGRSDKWPQDSENVPVLLLEGEGTTKFYVCASLSVCCPPVSTEGAHIPNPRPCRAITPAGKEGVYLSSEESVASLEHEFNSPHDVSVLHNLGIDPEEKKPKWVGKKKVTVVGGAATKKPEVTGATSDAASRKGTARFRQGSLDDFVYVADSFEELYAIGGKPQGNVATGARSFRSAGSKDP